MVCCSGCVRLRYGVKGVKGADRKACFRATCKILTSWDVWCGPVKPFITLFPCFYQKHCGTLIPLGSVEWKGVVFKGIDFWGVSGGRLNQTRSGREMRRRIDWIWSAPFFSLFSLFFSYFFSRTHARFFFSSRKPGEFGQYIKHTHARTAAVDRSCNQLSGELMVCSTVYTI